MNTTVRVDVGLRTTGGPALLPGLSLFRAADRSLHLVPSNKTGEELFITVAAHGLDVTLIAPWTTGDERAEGLERAAAETVRAIRRARWND